METISITCGLAIRVWNKLTQVKIYRSQNPSELFKGQCPNNSEINFVWLFLKNTSRAAPFSGALAYKYSRVDVKKEYLELQILYSWCKCFVRYGYFNFSLWNLPLR